MGRIRRFLPSPAMVVAVTALVMSLSGGAYEGLTANGDADLRKAIATNLSTRLTSVMKDYKRFDHRSLVSPGASEYASGLTAVSTYPLSAYSRHAGTLMS